MRTFTAATTDSEGVVLMPQRLGGLRPAPRPPPPGPVRQGDWGPGGPGTRLRARGLVSNFVLTGRHPFVPFPGADQCRAGPGA